MRPLPDTVDTLLADLEQHYPPRCKDPTETLEEHLIYAGQVQLITDLRIRFDWTQDNYRMATLLNKD